MLMHFPYKVSDVRMVRALSSLHCGFAAQVGTRHNASDLLLKDVCSAVIPGCRMP